MNQHIPEEWQLKLQQNQLGSFDQLWNLSQRGWFEPPNERRGGWSGVVLTTLSTNQANDIGIFVKLQENHVYRAWFNLFIPAATLSREFKFLMKFQKLNIPTLETIYFCQKKQPGKLQAILATRELDGFQALDNEMLQSRLKDDIRFRKQVISRIAAVLRHMHDHHLQHNCLYPKHIFVKELPDGSIDVRLIDLEKVKWTPFQYQAMRRDLGSLQRHSEGWSRTDRLRLFLAYRQEQHLGSESRKVLRSILAPKKNMNRTTTLA